MEKRLLIVAVALVIFGMIVGAAIADLTPTQDGQIPVWDDTAQEWVLSSGIRVPTQVPSGYSIVCVGNSSTCDQNITWDGTDMTING